ncbi:serine hydrolase domain-containing protein [Lutimonas sp.]|uniref:serine hydrolase domain-containing protein n=1 Tax=Lutimonas sp. TaxID=1872403 RepID=UPI003D9BCB1E
MTHLSIQNKVCGLTMLFFSILCFGQASSERINSDSLSLELETITKRDHINGIGVAIVDEKGTIYEKGFGLADKGLKVPYTSESIQNIASISKTFLGLALLKAQEMGKLHLDDPINKYLPFTVKNPYHSEVPITIRQLSTHTSSIQDSKYYDQKSYVLKESLNDGQLAKTKRPENFNPPEAYTSMGEFLQKCLDPEGEWYTKKGFLKAPPGAKFEYSNVGATLAAYVLELATGQDYGQFSKKHILEPLHMSSSGWSFDEINMEKHTVMYENIDQALPYYKLITYPDGGLITSVHDLALYLTELIKGYSGNGTILSPQSYQELFKQQLSDSHFDERNPDNDYNDEYNMGVFMGFSAIGNIGHSGGDPGVTTLMFFNAESKAGQLIFVNTGLDEDGFQEFVDIWLKLETYRKKL